MDLDRHKAFLEPLYAAAGAGRNNQAHALGLRNDVSAIEARRALETATKILEWRLGSALEWRVLRFAQALIGHDRKHQGDLFEAPR